MAETLSLTSWPVRLRHGADDVANVMAILSLLCTTTDRQADRQADNEVGVLVLSLSKAGGVRLRAARLLLLDVSDPGEWKCRNEN
jgi:hypothetical protein